MQPGQLRPPPNSAATGRAGEAAAVQALQAGGWRAQTWNTAASTAPGIIASAVGQTIRVQVKSALAAIPAYPPASDVMLRRRSAVLSGQTPFVCLVRLAHYCGAIIATAMNWRKIE